MTSGPLVAQSPASGFSQQGQVDWVELSGKSVQFSVAVLSRLSRAGIDAYTLHVGRAICLSFALDPIAQERIADAIFKLKKYSSYGDLIWFGFGVKHVVTDLAETEEGLTLVALCAALTTTYDSTYSARVLRELYVLQKAPKSFTPALRQWKAIVELCSGILASSHFVLILNGFRRLILSQSNMPDLKCRQFPTPPTDLAKAILTLASVSRKNLVNATFTGGLDCAWLAALPEWVLSLDVEILSSSGLSFYRSRLGVGILPQVTIVCTDETTTGMRPELVVSRAVVVPRGCAIVHTVAYYEPQCGNFLNWRSPWSSILHDTFHEMADLLLTNETGRHFAIYLRCMFLIQSFNPIQDSSPRGRLYDSDVYGSPHRHGNHYPVDPLLCIREDTSGKGFVAFACKRLPEMAASSWLHCPEVTEMDDLYRLAESSFEALRGACSCSMPPNGQERAQGTVFCLKGVAETIHVFLLITRALSIDDDVYPSVTGLTNLYSWLASYDNRCENHTFSPIPTERLPVLGENLAFHVLTGLPDLGQMKSTEEYGKLASVGEGLCIYRAALEDPRLGPAQISQLRVVRGYVAYNGARFSSITGLVKAHGAVELPYERFDYLLYGSPPLSIEMIIQESNDETKLELAYLIRYIDAKNRSCNVWLDLGYLLSNLVRITKIISCAGNCKPLYKVPFVWDNRINSRFRKINTEAVDIDVDIAQRTIQDIKDTDNIWILIIEAQPLVLFTKDPMLLYLLLQNSNIRASLHPFTKCLSCITVFGYWYGILQFHNEPGYQKLAHTAKVTLITPNNRTSTFKWELRGSEAQ